MTTTPTRTDDTPTRRAPRPGSARAALSHRDFRQVWMGVSASNIGTWMQNVVLPAYVYSRTGKASLLALLVFAQLGPLLVLSIPAGVIADRFDRRRWLITMQSTQLVFAVALFPLVAQDAPIWSLVLVQLGIGIGNAMAAPAYSAALPAMVGREDLAGAISLNSAQINGTRVIGPVIAGLLALWGVSTSQFMLINAFTYFFVIGALFVSHIPPVAPPAEGVVPEKGMRLLSSGIRLAYRRPVIRRLLVTLTTFSLFSLPYVGLFPAVAEKNFGIDSETATYKWLYATWGLGAMVGALAIGTVFVSLDKRRLIRLGFATFAVWLAVFAVVRSPGPAFAVGFLLGASYFGTTTAMLTVLQSRLADAERGRVMALWFMAFGGTVPIGNIVFGPVMDVVGARWVMFGGALWAGFLAWWCNIERLDRRSADAAEQPTSHPVEARHP
jgi:MFS family permease